MKLHKPTVISTITTLITIPTIIYTYHRLTTAVALHATDKYITDFQALLMLQLIILTISITALIHRIKTIK